MRCLKLHAFTIYNSTNEHKTSQVGLTLSSPKQRTSWNVAGAMPSALVSNISVSKLQLWCRRLKLQRYNSENKYIPSLFDYLFKPILSHTFYFYPNMYGAVSILSGYKKQDFTTRILRMLQPTWDSRAWHHLTVYLSAGRCGWQGKHCMRSYNNVCEVTADAVAVNVARTQLR